MPHFKGHGEGGIRTLGSFKGYEALAKLCFRPLSHLTKDSCTCTGRRPRRKRKVAHARSPGQSRNFLLAISNVSDRSCGGDEDAAGRSADSPRTDFHGRSPRGNTEICARRCAATSMPRGTRPALEPATWHRGRRRRILLSRARRMPSFPPARCRPRGQRTGHDPHETDRARQRRTGGIAARVRFAGCGRERSFHSDRDKGNPRRRGPGDRRGSAVRSHRNFTAARSTRTFARTRTPHRSPAREGIGGEQTGTLRVSPERRQPFIVADVIAGEPHSEDSVFYSSENQLHLASSSNHVRRCSRRALSGAFRNYSGRSRTMTRAAPPHPRDLPPPVPPPAFLSEEQARERILARSFGCRRSAFHFSAPSDNCTCAKDARCNRYPASTIPAWTATRSPGQL